MLTYSPNQKQKTAPTWIILIVSICLSASAKDQTGIGFYTSGDLGLILTNNQSDAQLKGFGAGFGLEITKTLSKHFSLSAGIQYNKYAISGYRGDVIFYSEWTSGTTKTDVTVETSINQDYLKFPLLLYLSKHKAIVGVGAMIDLLIKSSFNRHSVGYYPLDIYPSYEETFNKRIRICYEVTDYPYTAPFTKVNISPAVVLGYCINKRFTIKYLLSYSILSNPQVYENLPAYNQLNNTLILTFNIKQYEN